MKVIKTPITYISFLAEGELLNYRHRPNFLLFSEATVGQFRLQSDLSSLIPSESKKNERIWRIFSEIISYCNVYLSIVNFHFLSGIVFKTIYVGMT